MTTTRIKEIRDRWAQATKGPWKHYNGQSVYDSRGGDVAEAETVPDALAIAAAPDDIRWLCEQVERLEGEAQCYRDTTDRICGMVGSSVFDSRPVENYVVDVIRDRDQARREWMLGIGREVCLLISDVVVRARHEAKKRWGADEAERLFPKEG